MIVRLINWWTFRNSFRRKRRSNCCLWTVEGWL